MLRPLLAIICMANTIKKYLYMCLNIGSHKGISASIRYWEWLKMSHVKVQFVSWENSALRREASLINVMLFIGKCLKEDSVAFKELEICNMFPLKISYSLQYVCNQEKRIRIVCTNIASCLNISVFLMP